ncbi:MAG: copper homeostasis protein CutC [Planctomycetes bacterium]|nr:copper homeostasis protein CutC [Planctomycetota bacterium]
MTLLEVVVDSTADLRRAEEGGAQRIELCSRLEVGGVTPTRGLLELAQAQSKLPLCVMVRPRGGDFTYDAAELDSMRENIAWLKERKVMAVVLGVLRADRTLDIERMREFVALARPLKVTCHRAFDRTPDTLAALDELIALGVDRVLTTGGASDAHAGRRVLRKLVERARGRIVVLAGGGVRAHNWREIVADGGVREIHSSTVFPLD